METQKQEQKSENMQSEANQIAPECEAQMNIEAETLVPNAGEILMQGKVWDDQGVLVVDSETCIKNMVNYFLDNCKKFDEEICNTDEKKAAFATICTSFLVTSLQCMYSVSEEKHVLQLQHNMFAPLLQKFKTDKEETKVEEKTESQLI